MRRWPRRSPPWTRPRARFVRRMAFMFGTMLLLSVLGASTLISMLFGRYERAGTALPGALIVLLVLFFVGSFAMRRVVTSRLESQDRRRRRLLADIAHELRTPLSVIQGRLEGMIDGVYPLDAAQIGQVLAGTRMLTRLVDDLRTLAQSESGTLTLQKEPTDIAILTQDVIDSLTAQASAQCVTLRFDASHDLPIVSVDPLRVREILVNLIVNALNHTPADGAISIALRMAGDRVVATVADTGTGIAAEDLPRIFDRFYKGPSSKGSGLGLAIARDLVAAHGGEIRAESRPGHGTTMTFSLRTGD